MFVFIALETEFRARMCLELEINIGIVVPLL